MPKKPRYATTISDQRRAKNHEETLPATTAEYLARTDEMKTAISKHAYATRPRTENQYDSTERSQAHWAAFREEQKAKYPEHKPRDIYRNERTAPINEPEKPDQASFDF